MTQQLPVPRRLARRWAARLVDWLLILAVTSPVWLLTVGHIKRNAALNTASFTGDGVTGLLSMEWDDVGDSAAAGLSDVWGTVTFRSPPRSWPKCSSSRCTTSSRTRGWGGRSAR